MASKREIDLQNQVQFRNEMLDERKARMEAAGRILEQIMNDGSVDIGVEDLCAHGINILGGHVAI